MTIDAGEHDATGWGIPAPAYRLPAALRLGTARLQIASLERSLSYYQRVLGLALLRRDARSALLGTRAGMPIVELVERPGIRPSPHQARLGLYHFAILLPDRSALGRFITHLAAIGERAGASDHLVSEALYLHDPDGLGIEVYADRPRDEWRTLDREIRMDTKPLDVESVVRCAHGATWDGVPDGTVPGHMHLHVTDLDAAARFYHDGLGFDKMVWSYPGALFLGAGGYHHHLGVNTWAGAAAPRASDEEAQLLDWGIVLPTARDVAAAAERIAAAGYAVHLEGEAPLLTDPSGTRLRLVAADSVAADGGPVSPPR